MSAEKLVSQEQVSRLLPLPLRTALTALRRELPAAAPELYLVGGTLRDLLLGHLAAENLGVNFIMLSPPNFWWFQQSNLEMSAKLDKAPGLTLVYQKNSIRIYAVNAKIGRAHV